jgi:hypothetical protein
MWGGIIVHECLGGSEFGDAPEEDTAYIDPVTIGYFPTCVNVGPVNSHVIHGCPSALFFGGLVDCEGDGNAGWCPTFGPNWYNMDECGTYPLPLPPVGIDEGLMFPVPATILLQPTPMGYFPCGQQTMALDTVCNMAIWGQNIDIWVDASQAVGGFFNVLFDWNRDGDWMDVSDCNGTPVPEHVVVDFPVPAGFVGPVSVLVPPNFQIGPKKGYVWARFTLSEIPVGPDWDGSGNFADGESEDYLILVVARPEIPLSNWPLLLAVGLIALLTIFIWWRRR